MSRQKTTLTAATAGLATAAVVLILTPAAALAQGPPVENQTERVVNQVETLVDVHPCTGQPAELTLVENGVIHFVALADGSVHIAGTLRGTFSVDALPADGVPDATGTFTSTFGGNGQLLEEGGVTGRAEVQSTLNGRGENADGSAFGFHAQEHTVFDTAGVPKLDFAKAHCT